MAPTHVPLPLRNLPPLLRTTIAPPLSLKPRPPNPVPRTHPFPTAPLLPRTASSDWAAPEPLELDDPPEEGRRRGRLGSQGGAFLHQRALCQPAAARLACDPMQREERTQSSVTANWHPPSAPVAAQRSNAMGGGGRNVGVGVQGGIELARLCVHGCARRLPSSTPQEKQCPA